MSVNHKKRTKSQCSSFKQICKKACFMSATKPYLPIRNRISFNNGSKQGQVSKLPFKDKSFLVLDAASKTIRSLVVSRSFLITTRYGR